MKKSYLKIIINIIVLTVFLSLFSHSAFAQMATGSYDNIWYGDELAVNVRKGENGYTFMSVYENPHHAYEISHHIFKSSYGNKIPQTFVLVDSEAYDNSIWSPNGLYDFYSSNYEVLYCCDIETGIENGKYYKRINLEDSEYYSADAATNIRSIVTNSYPYVSLEAMKNDLRNYGFPYADELTRADAIAAVQIAIWTYANNIPENERLTYLTSHIPSKFPNYGGLIHDYSSELNLGNVKNKYNDEQAATRVAALVEHLLSLNATYAEKNQIIITELEIIEAIPVIATENTFTVALKVALNNSGSGVNDNIYINVFADNNLIKSEKVEYGKEIYDLVVEAVPGQTLKTVVSGSQMIPLGVYFYEAEPEDVSGDGIATGREPSQNLVGVAEGMTAVHAEKEVFFGNEIKNVSADIKLIKTNELGMPLTGAGFDLYLKSENSTYFIGTYNVNENGEIYIENILPGSYEFIETTVPFGFLPLANSVKFTVDEIGAVNVETNNEVSVSENGEILVKNYPETISISGEKIWVDENDHDGKRPESITVRLYANGLEVNSVITNAENNWKWYFNNVNKYDAGSEIFYSVSEDPIDSYVSEISGNVAEGFVIKNIHMPEKITISGFKTWDDSNNSAGMRPYSITINLHADGVLIDSKTVTEYDNWAWNFGEYDKYENGREIQYTITEDSVYSYVSYVNGFNITNTYISEKTNVYGIKSWVDNDNSDGIRPEFITVYLTANGIPVDTAVVSAQTGWRFSFNNLDRYYDGREITYYVYEEPVEGYTSSVAGSALFGFILTNTHIPETVSVQGSKTWIDDNNVFNTRPESITVNLFANEEYVTSKIISQEDNWSWSFDNLPRYNNGEEITYTISEDRVEGYATEINGHNIVNTYIYEEEVLEEIPDEEVPLAGSPSDISEEEIMETLEEILEEIIDEEVPLVDNPITSDDPETETNFIILLPVSVAIAIFFCIAIFTKKVSLESKKNN
ncbi:MAG: Cna B-type domain-containing protein [Ruminococcaceae bacterium]|nr:Cna B-type domain-containing protein [Oscillospiraceae bacterium]